MAWTDMRPGKVVFQLPADETARALRTAWRAVFEREPRRGFCEPVQLDAQRTQVTLSAEACFAVRFYGALAQGTAEYATELARAYTHGNLEIKRAACSVALRSRFASAAGALPRVGEAEFFVVEHLPSILQTIASTPDALRSALDAAPDTFLYDLLVPGVPHEPAEPPAWAGAQDAPGHLRVLASSLDVQECPFERALALSTVRSTLRPVVLARRPRKTKLSSDAEPTPVSPLVLAAFRWLEGSQADDADFRVRLLPVALPP